MRISDWSSDVCSSDLVDEEMNDVPHDGTTRGELVLRAPWLTRCYTGDVAASRALWRGGWMHTQDIATIDALRADESRLGKECDSNCTSRWSPSHYNQIKQTQP